ncbi:MAG: amino acid adenylation domain-containing protein, partial [Acidobacteria bacterium]|nr:amino acid adenylation domain-containing protein [Acidobacteriota bacterium]
MDIFQRISKLSPKQLKLLESKIGQDFDINKIPISPDYRKNYQYFPLSFEQAPLWIVEKLDPDNPSYDVMGTLWLEGDLNIDILEKSINEVVKRQEILRAIFIMQEEKPVKVILPSLYIPLKRIDLKELSREEQENYLKQMRQDHTLYMFDLAKGPLVKVILVELGENKYIFFSLTHHIISDLLSLKIFIKETAWFYQFFSQGTPPAFNLPELPFQYVDYACWQHRWYRESSTGIKARKKQEKFWLDMFSEEIPVLNLPTDYPRPPAISYEGDHAFYSLKSDLLDSLKEFYLKENTTLYVLLYTVLYIFLAKVSGQEDIVVGTLLNTRKNASLNNLIGIFARTIALRTHPQGDKPFRKFLAEVNKLVLEVYNNQEYLYEELVKEVLVERDFSRNPLFDVLYNFIYIDISEIGMPGIRVTPYNFKSKRTGFDLEFVCERTYNELYLRLTYSTKLFKTETIKRFISYFHKIITTIVKAPDVKIYEIEVMSDEEKKEILNEFNNTQTDYPKNKTIPQLFIEQAAKTPDHIALFGHGRTRTNTDNNNDVETLRATSLEIQISYQELNQQSSRLAQLLIEKGVLPDIIVGIMMERTVAMITVIMGIMKAGGAYLPIDPDFPGERIDYMLKDIGTKLLIANNEKIGDKVNSWKGDKVLLESIIPSLNQPFHHSAFIIQHSNHLAYIIYTSGSTGKPKGVMIEHRAVHNFMVGITRLIEFNPRKVILALTTVTFDIFGLETLLPFCRGLKVVLADENHQRELPLLEQLIIKNCIDMIQVTPTRMQMFMLGDASSSCLKNLKEIIVGGEAFPLKLLENLRLLSKAKIYNMYGPTETTIWSTAAEVTRAEKITIGSPIANTQVYILNKYARFQMMGVAGELLIGGDGTARGYINRPELTAEKFDQDLWDKKDGQDKSGALRADFQHSKSYRTGDLARWLPDGNIEFLGRIDQQAKIRGMRIEPGEIENRLLKHEQVNEAVVVVKVDSVGDKYLSAYFVSDKEIPVSELKEFLAKDLPEYMIPMYFTQLEKIPLAPSGKVDRRMLPEPELKAGEGYIPPRNETEKKLVEIWSDILGRDPFHSSQLRTLIGIADNFFQLGGHSLRVTILATRIHKEFNVRVLLGDIFRMPYIKSLAELISQSVKDKYTVIEPVENKEYYAVSSFQKRLYVLQMMDLKSTAYNLPAVMILKGKVDKNKLEQLFLKLIKRHESLRTSFKIIHGETVQMIHDLSNFEIEYIKGSAKSSDDIIKEFIRPFDLSQSPLLRIGLIKEQNHCIFMIDLHHIIADGISEGILIEDFKTLYNGNEPAPIKIRYRDFSAWHNSAPMQENIKKQEQYWLNKFSGELPVLNLASDYTRSDVQDFAGGHVRFEFSKEESVQLKQIALEQGATLFMILLAIMTIFISKLSGQEDIIIGTPISGRSHPDLEHIIGMFANTIALRNYPAGEKTFVEFLDEVKENCLEAFENQDYPFEYLVEKLSVSRLPGRNPLF